MAVSDDAAAIAASNLVQAHVATVGTFGQLNADERIKKIAWVYQQFLEVVRNGGPNHDDGPPIS